MALKVLTVDDSKTIRMIVKKAFRTYDCELFEAENGVEGLAIAAREKPDLIVLDITMPVMNGVEMLDRLKSEKGMQDIPVIMLTAESGKDNVMKIVKRGVRDYIVKPFKGEDLIERVEKIVKLETRKDDDVEEEKSAKYFTQVGDIHILTLPGKITRPVSVELDGHLRAKLKEIAASAMGKIILDLRKISETNVSLIKLIISTLERCQRAKIAVQVIATPKQSEELKSFQETGHIATVNSLEDAKAAF